MYYLSVKSLDGMERRIALRPGITTVGSDPDNTLVLDERGVSRRHAAIHTDGKHVRISDRDSTNGVQVNGRTVEQMNVFAGDRIVLGSVLMVLQEAVSDRLLIRDRRIEPLADGDGEGDAPASVVLERVSGPRGRSAPMRDEATLLGEQLVQAFARNESPTASLRSAMRLVQSFTGTVGGFLLGLRGEDDYYLRDSVGLDDDLVISRSVIRRALETGSPVCVDESGKSDRDPSREPTAFICVPLGGGAAPRAALYLVVAPSRLRDARARLQQLEHVLPLFSLIADHAELDGRLSRLEEVREADAARYAEIADDGNDDFVAHSEAMTAALSAIDRVASSTGPLLICGPRGAGKRRAARRLHRLSGRRGAMLPIACHQEGCERLLDARKFELARQGTLVLEEIGRLKARQQERLLSELDDAPQDLRLLATSSMPPEDLVADSGISDGLLARLGPQTVVVPSLRERRADVVALAQHFARRFATAVGRRIEGLSVPVCDLLRDYHWPGNVLELQLVIRRALLLTTDEIIDVGQLPLDPAAASARGGTKTEMRWEDAKLTFEREYFRDLLAQSGGNVTSAARSAGIARKNFYYKMKQHGIVRGS